MWLVPLTFGLSLAIVLGVYWLFVLRPEGRSKRALTGRLGKVSKASTVGTLVKEEKRLSSIPQLDQALDRVGVFTRSVQQLIDGADLSVTVGTLLLGSALLGAVTTLLITVVSKQIGIAILAGAVACLLPTAYIRRKRTVRMRQFEEQFPEAIDLIARAMRAGHGLTSALGMVADEMGAPVGREFRLMYDWQNYGMALPEAFQRFAERVPLLDARFFATTVLTQRESGGNLSEVLDNLAKVIRERFRVKRQIRVISAHGRITGLVLSALPPSLAFYFLLTRPSYLTSLLYDPLGQRVILVAVVLQVIGMLVIRRLVDVEY